MPTKTSKFAAKGATGKGTGTLTPIQRFESLSDAEKEAIWESFNRPVDRSDLRPLTAAERKLWDTTQAALQARRAGPRGRGRPRVGAGARNVQVTIEGDLLAKADDYAKAHHMKRSEMVAAGLRLVMAGGIKTA